MNAAPRRQTAPALADLLRPLGNPPVEGIYAHIPFCFHKCHYCDFYSIVDERDRQAAFVGRLLEEAAAAARLVSGRPSTIFIGGGTPTLLRADLWRRLLEGLAGAFDLSRLVEFTVEANPETVTAELMETLAAGGVNRISIGAQSFDERHLRTLERWHDPASVGRAVRAARGAGIANVSLDLIFAVPGQTLGEWRLDLERALSLRPAHLSCYSLMYEPNTPLTRKLELGRLERCHESLEAAMYEATIRALADAGFEHYEVSNFALPAKRCRHNLLYWRNGDWLALGPSASGHIGGLRWKNAPHLGHYLASASAGTPVQDVERLDPRASLGEQLMLRLRLIEGADLGWLAGRLDSDRRRAVEEQVAAGLLERTATHLRLTRRGLLFADAVIAELL